MKEEITIANSTCQGLVSKKFIFVEEANYDFDSDPRELIPFTVSGKYGLMDKDKHIVLEPQYDVILDTAENENSLIRIGVYHYVNFKNRNAPQVCRRSTLGVINTKGEFVIPMIYRSISLPFNSTLFSVEKEETGSHGVIDINNNIVVPFDKYINISGFSNGYAKVKNSENKWGIINENGIEVLPCMYPNIWAFYKKDYPTAIVETDDGQRQFDFKIGKLIDRHKTLAPNLQLWEKVELEENSD